MRDKTNPAPRPQTEDAYMAWAMQGYIRDFGLSARDAFDLARIDWQLRLEALGWKAPMVKKVDGLDMHKQLSRAGKRGGHRGAEALARARRLVKSKDFRGVEFDSFPEMCRRWGKNPSTVKKRLAHGWSLERALTEPVSLLSLRGRNK